MSVYRTMGSRDGEDVRACGCRGPDEVCSNCPNPNRVEHFRWWYVPVLIVLALVRILVGEWP